MELGRRKMNADCSDKSNGEERVGRGISENDCAMQGAEHRIHVGYDSASVGNVTPLVFFFCKTSLLTQQQYKEFRHCCSMIPKMLQIVMIPKDKLFNPRASLRQRRMENAAFKYLPNIPSIKNAACAAWCDSQECRVTQHDLRLTKILEYRH